MHPIHVNASGKTLRSVISKINPDKIGVIVDENTKTHCLPRLQSKLKHQISVIRVHSGEIYKDTDTLHEIWEQMYRAGMTRKSLTINLGGGVIGDMGGFAASTYMRGMQFIQMPTTLLSMVDASVGGKLGVDFHQMKNFIGIFNEPHMVWIDTKFLKTLPTEEIKSGFGEVIKHSLIADKKLWKEIRTTKKIKRWKALVKQNINIKKAVVKADPFEGGVRKILNYGHTIGHAIESHYLTSTTPLLHGYAIGFGMIVENIISHQKGMLSKKDMQSINSYLKEYYPSHPMKIKKSSINKMIDMMKMDKKNANGEIRMSLIEKPGRCHYNVPVSPAEIKSAMEESSLFSR